jgi:arylsulfatase A-like enzyme
MITRLDTYVGRLLDLLVQLRLDRNTLVIFTSDNGPHRESSHQLDRFQPSGPLQGLKRSLKDGGIRVPCIAWWPGRVGAGRASGHVAYFGDWFATACELAGAPLPYGLDSVSIVPELLADGRSQPVHEFLYWEFHEGGFSQAALYQGRWKGIRDGPPAAPLALYDLRSDVAEKTDLASHRPDLVARIEAYLRTARSDSPDWPVPPATASTRP